MLLRSSSAIPFQTITALAESPRRRGLLYAGTDDGKLHVTQDDGKTWTELTGNVPTRRWYSRVVPSQHADGTVYVTQRGREDDDFGVYVYKSTDFGKTFTSLAANIPAGSVNVMREHPTDAERALPGHRFRRLHVGRRRTAVAGPRRRPAVGAGLGPGLPRARQPHRDFDLRPRDVGAGCACGWPEVHGFSVASRLQPVKVQRLSTNL